MTIAGIEGLFLREIILLRNNFFLRFRKWENAPEIPFYLNFQGITISKQLKPFDFNKRAGRNYKKNRI